MNINVYASGAITCIRWNSDGSALVTVGEDGRVLQWSKTVNLRSKLAQNDNAIYCVAWSPDDQAVVFATARKTDSIFLNTWFYASFFPYLPYLSS